MITTHNFNQTYRQFQSGVIPYRLLQHLAAVMISIYSVPHSTVENALDITNDHINWLLLQDASTFNYADILGGDMYVCEVETDLKQIQGCDFEWAEAHGGVWPNVTDKALVWDDCRYLQESKGEPQWVTFFLASNNAGGPVYFVPKSLWGMARVEEHIAVTEKAFK